MKWPTIKKVALVIITMTATGSAPALAALPVYSAVIVKTYPHDPHAFTEGLFYQDGFLYESTGQQGESSIRKTMLETGKVLQQHDIDRQYFGEGIVAWKDKLIELTWQSKIGFVYNLNTFTQISDFHYTGEGWALTQDGSRLIMSDGTSDLRILDPDTMRVRSRIHVTCEGRPVHNINEVEWVKGEIYANIWLTNLIVRIDATTGKVVGFIDLSNLTALVHPQNPDSVPNGIAYDAAADRLFVTGKLWPSLFQIGLSRQPDGQDLCRGLP